MDFLDRMARKALGRGRVLAPRRASLHADATLPPDAGQDVPAEDTPRDLPPRTTGGRAERSGDLEPAGIVQQVRAPVSSVRTPRHDAAGLPGRDTGAPHHDDRPQQRRTESRQPHRADPARSERGEEVLPDLVPDKARESRSKDLGPAASAHRPDQRTIRPRRAASVVERPAPEDLSSPAREHAGQRGGSHTRRDDPRELRPAGEVSPSPRQGSAAPESTAPIVRITIGRVEVRAVQPAPKQAPAPPQDRRLGLHEYLTRRGPERP